MRRTLYLTLVALLLALLGVAAYLWSPLKENQSLYDAQAAAHAYKVEIIRDSWGVPHIFGERDADVVFGLAYAQSEDDLQTLQSVIAATRGKLARYQGADAAVSDYLVNLLNVWPLVDGDYSTRLSKAARDIAEAYAAGVNLYAAENPQKSMQGLYPINGKDVVAGFVFKTPFFYGAQKVLTQLLTGTEERALAIAPKAPNTAFHFLPGNDVELGSKECKREREDKNPRMDRAELDDMHAVEQPRPQRDKQRHHQHRGYLGQDQSGQIIEPELLLGDDYEGCPRHDVAKSDEELAELIIAVFFVIDQHTGDAFD